MFKSVNRTNVAQAIINQIRNAIIQKHLKPGDKLPPEKELIDKFQVSKQTLREALRALEYLGLIEIKKGANGGAFVAEVDIEITIANLINFLHSRNLSIRHLTEVRKVIEPYCAKIAAEKISEEDLNKLQNSIELCTNIYSRGYSAEVTESEINFHRIIANTTQNPIMILITDFVEDILQDTKNILRPDKAFSKAVIEAHSRIYNAIADRNPEKAYNEMLKDVSNVGERLIKIAEEPGIGVI